MLANDSRPPVDDRRPRDGVAPSVRDVEPARRGRRGRETPVEPDGVGPRPTGPVTRRPMRTPWRTTPTHDPVAEAAHRRRAKVWFAALSAVAVLVVLGVCGYGTWSMFKDETDNSKVVATRPSQVVERDISSRDVDPEPLTELEVFPGPVPGTNGTYAVLKTQLNPDCRAAATEDIGTLLVQLGCNQVVRGTLRSSNGQYLVTAGIFNLKDQVAADQANVAIKPTIAAQKGRFLGMLGGDGSNTDAIMRGTSHLAWFAKGHFVGYCVLALANGDTISADDPAAKQIVTDIVESYLRGFVIQARAVKMVNGPTAKPGAAR